MFDLEMPERPEWAHDYMRYDGEGWVCDGCPYDFCDCDMFEEN